MSEGNPLADKAIAVSRRGQSILLLVVRAAASCHARGLPAVQRTRVIPEAPAMIYPVNGSEMMNRLANVIDGHHWEDLAGLLHQDFSCRYVHTGEHFDRDAWVRLNAEDPGFQGFVLEDRVGQVERAAGRAHVTAESEGQLHHFEVATFITVRNDLISDMTEVWKGVDEAAPVGSRPV